MGLFQKLAAEIDKNYAVLGHQSCWTFLYTPQETFRTNQKLAFIGLNPGGAADQNYKNLISCEDGNAYLVSDWENGYPPRNSPLQLQIQALYKGIASHRPQEDYEKMMNDSLAMNFIPYRSQSFAKLKNKNETLKFCQGLLEESLEYTQPQVTITMDKLAYAAVIKAFKKLYPDTEIQTEHEQIGWGKVEYEITTLLDAQKRLIVRIPHLSRYKIFNCEKCKPQIKRITKIISDSISRNCR
ncbi:MAG: hypothetical protein H6865_03915 [Rhodospirillales bacterium]|nr:hypothetical protein [Alphaproteobacteria bacterium]MCB9986763.1 hypothetical protein [Rhodospirillales bacterium]USO08466.1 MAG: hypothetical protein H6866_04460 [Rhodospirillales bacterium]